MANYIEKNNITIFRCANWVMEMFHENLKGVIIEQGLSNESLNNFLEHLDQDYYGRGCVIAELTEYFGDGPDKLPLQLFYDLTTKAIDKIKQKELGEYRENYLKLLNDFKERIL